MLKISKTHSCKRSSSVKQGQVQGSSGKVPFMELLLAWRCFCFVTLLWRSLRMPTLCPFPATTRHCPVFCTRGIPILFRNQMAMFFVGGEGQGGRLAFSPAPRVRSWWFRYIMVISSPLSVTGLGLCMWLIILAHETWEKTCKMSSWKVCFGVQKPGKRRCFFLDSRI